MTLRPYQQEARQRILHEWQEGRRKTLLVLPTGCGKTIVFNSVAADQAAAGRRILILAHREELLEQAADKLKKSFKIDAALEKADSHATGSVYPVTVGSVQTMTRERRLAEIPQDYYDDIVIDEAHHALSDSYQRVLEHFPNANVLGVTATPDRGDKKNLGTLFDSIAYEYSMAEAIRDGYLCPIKAQLIPLNIDLAGVKVTAGDFKADDLGSALDPYLERIADEMVDYCFHRKTVIFLPLIATSKRFCELLNERGFRAAEVNGKSEDRAEILADFDNGKYNALCNSMLLTEGWDCPSVDTVVVLRPTKVRSLYQQMVGRGTRLADGKDHLLILDFLWHTTRHALCRPSSLVAKNADQAERINKMIESGEKLDILEAEELAIKDAIKEREESLARQLREQRRKKKREVDPIQYAFSIQAEDLIDYEPQFKWEREAASEKQLDLLEKRGIDRSAVSCKGQATLLIDRLIKRTEAGLATPRQIRLLERYGFGHVGEWSFDAADKMITRISKAGWRIPRGVNPATYEPNTV